MPGTSRRRNGPGGRKGGRRRSSRPRSACFTERGFAATRLDDVAARAGVTKGTVYLYFPNKEELFKAVVRESLLPHLDRLMGAVPVELEDPAERIRRLFGFFANEVLESPLAAIPKLVIAEADNFPEIARFYVKEVISRGRAFVTETLRQGVERGSSGRSTRITYSSASSGRCSWRLWRWSLGPYDDRTLDAPAMIDNHLDIYFRGLAPSPRPSAGKRGCHERRFVECPRRSGGRPARPARVRPSPGPVLGEKLGAAPIIVPSPGPAPSPASCSSLRPGWEGSPGMRVSSD